MRLQVVYTKALESELNPKQGGHSFGQVPTLVLVPTKANPTTKERAVNGVRLMSKAPVVST